MLMHHNGTIDPEIAAVAAGVNRTTIIQAVCRLRAEGLVIITRPTPPGPFRVRTYNLARQSRSRAWDILAWWSQPDPEAWERYKQIVAESEA